MKVIKNISYLFTHVHLVVDGVREYLDGAIAVHEGKIHVILPQSDRLFSKWNHLRKINLHHALVQASFVVPYYQEANVPSFHERVSQGIGAYFVLVSKGGLSFFEKENDCAGIYLKDEYSTVELEDVCQHTSKIVGYISSSVAFDKKRVLDKYGIKVLEEDSFEFFHQENCLSLLANEEKIKCFSVSHFPKEYFRVLRNTSSRFSLWASPDQTAYRSLSLLAEVGYSSRDLAAISSYNVSSYFAKKAADNGLARGKVANLVCLGKNREIKFVIKDGDFYYG